MHHDIIVFLIGFLLGGFAVAWLCWTYLHTKWDSFECDMHDRYTAFQAEVARHFHRAAPAPISAPAEIPSTEARAAEPAAGTPAGSGTPETSVPPAPGS